MPETDLSLLIDAARGAAEIALRYWKTDLRVETKDGGSPVTEADYAVDDYLRDLLIRARPGYGWLSEEKEDDGARLGHDTVFIVDPIDGTRAYMDGEPTWAHSLAVAHRGRPVAAVVYLPARDKLYTAVAGQGVWLNSVPIGAGNRSDPDGATVLAPRASLDAQWWARTPPMLQRHFRPSLAYRFCLVAEARFDAMLTIKDAWEWDIAAGALIAEEAGALVTDRNNAPLVLNSEPAKSAGIFTAAPNLHAALLSRYL
ncbi:MAG: 3'(2'),5'-bisphosphate nucleotidase CysQ [Rhodobacteraceae bacterium]|nr:3'(2'),5'-bisphosphate nucleotidase CysQ [Paracoccaceae bacterium]